MPIQWFVPTCNCHQLGVQFGSNRCEKCGTPMRFDHWGYSMTEGMAAYQRFWHLKPVGPHRHFCDRILAGLSESCSACQGHGVLGDQQADSWVVCETCDGTGYKLIGTKIQLDDALAQIRAAYPGVIDY